MQRILTYCSHAHFRCVDDWGKKWGTGAAAVLPEDVPRPCSPSNADDDEGFWISLRTQTASFESLKEQSEYIGQSTVILGQQDGREDYGD